MVQYSMLADKILSLLAFGRTLSAEQLEKMSLQLAYYSERSRLCCTYAFKIAQYQKWHLLKSQVPCIHVNDACSPVSSTVALMLSF